MLPPIAGPTGGILAAGIGGGAYENAGRMVFNGGNLNVTAIDGGTSPTAGGVRSPATAST